jgi:hypothetical protein
LRGGGGVSGGPWHAARLRKAPSAPRSTGECRTGGTGSTSSKTASSGFHRLAPSATVSTGRWPTSLSNTVSRATSTFRTYPRSGTGPGTSRQKHHGH